MDGVDRIQIPLSINEPFHIQANPAGYPYLIPLAIEWVNQPTGTPACIFYPPGKPYWLKGSSMQLSVYDGSFTIQVDLPAGSLGSLPGPIHIRVTYQACDTTSCFKPAELPIQIPISSSDV